jgi:hypothetical protein
VINTPLAFINTPLAFEEISVGSGFALAQDQAT